MSKKMVGIIETIFDLVIDRYGVSKDETHIGRTDALSHMIKYTAPEKDEPALGLAPHVDINYLTILAQNEVVGLSIKRKEGDDWIPVDPGTDHFVIFAGCSLQAWSNGKVHPPFHRVVFRGLKDRLTWTVFLAPKPDQTVEPAPEFLKEEHPPRYRPFVYGEFHQHCIATFYAAGEHVLQEYAGK